MEHTQETSIKSSKSSSSKFGVEFQNQFVVLDDAKHVIGVDPSDGSKLILENIEQGRADKFGWGSSSYNIITTLLYHGKTGFLYTADLHGHLLQYKVDTSSKSCKRLKNYGDLGLVSISCSHRFLDFIFFGGIKSKIGVLDLSTGKPLLGHLETSINEI